MIRFTDCYQCGGEGWLDVDDRCLACSGSGRVSVAEFAEEIERNYAAGWISRERRAALLLKLGSGS